MVDRLGSSFVYRITNTLRTQISCGLLALGTFGTCHFLDLYNCQRGLSIFAAPLHWTRFFLGEGCSDSKSLRTAPELVEQQSLQLGFQSSWISGLRVLDGPVLLRVPLNAPGRAHSVPNLMYRTAKYGCDVGMFTRRRQS